MIPRKLARRLLDEYLDAVRLTSVVEPATGSLDYEALAAIEAEVLEESDLVLRGAENIEQKGRRYLTEGRLTVTRVDPQTKIIVATIRGTEGIYSLGYDPRKNEWRCTCPAPRRCAHLVALRLVVT